MNLIQNVKKKEYRFLLHFVDGREEERAVMAESFHAAVLGLPNFEEVGKYFYELKGGKS